MNRDRIPCPRIWVITAGMPCGPLEITAHIRTSKELLVNYVLLQMKGKIKGRVVLEQNRQPNLLFYRDKSGNPFVIER